MRRLIVAGAVALVGCATGPSPEELRNADYGAYPSNSDDIVRAYYSRTLKDPDSAQYRNISMPKSQWIYNRIEGPTYGYLVCATVNAKNSYGGYVGYQTDALIVRNGSVVRYLPKGIWGAKNLC